MDSIMNTDQLIHIALQSGATKACRVEQKDIVLNDAFRGMCEANRCGVYGKCYMCPPDVGDIHELMEKVRSYDCGLLYQTIYPLEDSYDFEGMVAAKKDFVGVTQRIREATQDLPGEEVLNLGAGGCGLCETCAKVTGGPCRYPDKAMPSLESCGMDVSGTCKNTPLKYINGPDTVTYLGMVLWREKK